MDMFTVGAFVSDYRHVLFQTVEAELVDVRVFSFKVFDEPKRLFPFSDELLVLNEFNGFRIILKLLQHLVVAT